MSEDARLRSILRSMAWQRAKGELESMGETYAGEMTRGGSRFQLFKEAMAQFVKEVEDNGLQE